MAKAIAEQMPQATFIPFEDAGHILFYEQPHKFNAALKDFVTALCGVTAVEENRRREFAEAGVVL